MSVVIQLAVLTRCFVLSVPSELDIIAEHRAELEFSISYVMLDSLKITVLWDRSIYSSLYLWR